MLPSEFVHEAKELPEALRSPGLPADVLDPIKRLAERGLRIGPLEGLGNHRDEKESIVHQQHLKSSARTITSI
jgi:hypothetical protein